ncbi:MAG: hypothetical protein IJT25_01130 [Clostridia bacterium]|nr:hypothetical protein [Clostridia bacterium]
MLEPHISTHGKPYVYATPNWEFSLFFGGRESRGDFDGMYGIKNNIPYFYEAYSNALKRRFDNVCCYIYEVDPSTFETNKTSFAGEVVSEEPVKILNCRKVNNVYELLLELHERKKVDLHFYQNSPAYVNMINKHITDRLIKFKILEDKTSGLYKFCKNHFPEIIEELKKEQEKTK